MNVLSNNQFSVSFWVTIHQFEPSEIVCFLCSDSGVQAPVAEPVSVPRRRAGAEEVRSSWLQHPVRVHRRRSQDLCQSAENVHHRVRRDSLQSTWRIVVAFDWRCSVSFLRNFTLWLRKIGTHTKLAANPEICLCWVLAPLVLCRFWRTLLATSTTVEELLTTRTDAPWSPFWTITTTRLCSVTHTCTQTPVSTDNWKQTMTTGFEQNRPFFCRNEILRTQLVFGVRYSVQIISFSAQGTNYHENQFFREFFFITPKQRASIDELNHVLLPQGYMTYIKNLPINDTPEIFGLHDNANITFAQNETFHTLECLLLLQPKSASGAGMSREEVRKLKPIFWGVCAWSFFGFDHEIASHM